MQTQGGPDALLYFGRETTNCLHAEFSFEKNGYQFDLVPTNDNRLIFRDEISKFFGHHKPDDLSKSLGSGHAESLLKNAPDRYSDFVQASVNNWRVYHFHDTGDKAKVKQKHSIKNNLGLKADAANLAAYLRMLKNEYPQEYQRIVDTIRLVAPFFGDFVHRSDDSEFIELEWTQYGKTDTPFKASANIMFLQSILMIVMKPHPPGA